MSGHTNYTLNYERIKKISNPIKLQQAQRYLDYIANVVAPNDAIVWYYLNYLEDRLKLNNTRSKKKIFEIVSSNPNWKTKLSELSLNI